jgi:hypothetical protein
MELLLFNELTNGTSVAFKPALLIVWNNVKSSVTALEVGLSAARCIQTVNASAEFALNIISLVHFGYEISEKGWIHGLTVIAKEIMTLHYRETGDTFSRSLASPNTRVTDAAIGAVRNTQVFHRNIQSMATDEHIGNVFQPIVDFLPTLIGRGWLWGHESSEHTTEIETSIRDETKTKADATIQESEHTIIIETKSNSIVTEISTEVHCTSVNNNVLASQQVGVQSSTGSTPSDVKSTTDIDCDNTIVPNPNSVDTMNASTLREQSQQFISEDFLAIAKKSKWVNSDVMERSFLLHMPSSKVSDEDAEKRGNDTEEVNEEEISA